MGDTEVEDVLREIRVRVRGQSLARRADDEGAATAAVARDVVTPEAVTAPASSSSWSSLDDGARARLEANLATTGRAWNKLPPLMSYRGGWLARLELWLKRQVKRATHWFTWEQVNFNSATHHALRDALAALSVYEQHIAALEREIALLRPEVAMLRPLKAEVEARQAELDARLSARVSEQSAAFETSIAALASRFASGNDELRNALTAIVEQSRRELEATHAAHSEQLREGLQHELRERVEHVQNEQRVCLKQLALESSETTVLMDRARRGVELRIDELAARVEELYTGEGGAKSGDG